MSLKKILIIPLVISLGFFIYFSTAVQNSFQELLKLVDFDGGLWAVLIAAAAFQIIGHIIRAKKATLLFGAVKDSTDRFQFRALSTGYLFNAILPFRLGELIRARIISDALTISFSLALGLIIVERALDALIIGILGLLIVSLAIGVAGGPFTYAVSLLVVSLILFALVMVVVRQNSRMLRWWYRFTDLFKDSVRDSLRFKAWSVIYGLQQTLRRPRMIRYVGLSLASWFFYGLSLFTLAQYLFPKFGLADKLLAALAPYAAVAIPSGPANLGTFSNVLTSFIKPLGIPGSDQLILSLLSWGVLILPITVIGIVLFFAKTRESLWRVRPRQASRQSLTNKLLRSEDISHELAVFLDNYFAGNTLTKIVHKLELSQDFRFMKYFKGGSDAITILALQKDTEVVKKIIPLEFEDRLKAQYDWLARHKGHKGIVKVLAEQKTDEFYAIDLEYNPENIMFFEYFHRTTLPKGQKVIENMWKTLYKYVYKKGELKYHPKERKQYIDKHIIGCFDKAAAVHSDLANAAEPERITINGTEYDNLFQILEKIKKHPQAWRDIATYQESATVFGDVSADNILVSTKTEQPLLIDPAPDGNIINGPVFDFGKNMQSFYCGYEFLFRDESPVLLQSDGSINYHDSSSAKYERLSRYIREELAPQYLSPEELRSMLFHGAALHIRRLKHQVYHNPANTLKFYAVGVKTLNDFLAQYEELESSAAAKPAKA